MNQRDQKRRNREIVLGILRDRASISQVELAERSRLQTSTVSNIVRTLKEAGIVRCTGKGYSGPAGGKKADLLSLDPCYGSFGGIAIKSGEIVSCVTDFMGSIVERRTLPTEGRDEEDILRLIIGEIRENASSLANYRGTGIAVSSIVSHSGDVARSLYFDHAIPGMAERIRCETDNLPLALENDANCAAYHDHLVSGGRYRNLVHLHVPTKPFTIGGGIVINGEVYRGALGAAGEILESGGERTIEDEIERIVLFVAMLLDTEAVFITGEFDEVTQGRVRALAGRLSRNGPYLVELLDSPDIPVLGASLQAIRLHLSRVLDE